MGRTDDINVISNVFIGGPAEAAGLLAGDGIVSVDGEDVTGMPVDELVEIVKGESGTEVVLEIRRPWDDPDSQMSVTVMRGVVPTSIETRIFGEDTDRPPIGYIRVERFHRETGDDFEEALSTLLERDIEGLILDVRYNPGGSLSGAVSIIGEFVPEGLAMYEMTREVAASNGRLTRTGRPMSCRLRCWSMGSRRARPRLWRERCRTMAAPRCTARERSARAACRRSRN